MNCSCPTTTGRRLAHKLALAAVLTFGSVPALAGDRWRLAVDLGQLSRSQSLESTSDYPEFAETTHVTSTQALGSSPVYSAEAQFRLVPRLGIALAFERSTQTGTAQLAASVPHPLYFRQPRQVEGQAADLEYVERALHLDLVALGTRGRLSLRGFAGLSFLHAQGRMLPRLQYTSVYPYDTVSFERALPVPAKDSGVGFNVGAGLDVALGKRFALGAQARFSRASLSLAADSVASGSEVSLKAAQVDAGGLAVSAGVRLSF